jgi:hypothetical protein
LEKEEHLPAALEDRLTLPSAAVLLVPLSLGVKVNLPPLALSETGEHIYNSVKWIIHLQKPK